MTAQRILILFVAALIIGSSLKVTAQTVSPIKLKVPSLDDFLTTIQAMLTADSTSTELRSGLVNVAEAEFIYRYLPDATYAERRRAFDTLKVDFGYAPVYYPQINPDKWIAWIVEAWLAENPADLDSLSELAFDDFSATIEQRDFKGDGTHEWVLDLNKGANSEDFEYHNWIVIAREDDQYRALPVPVWAGWNGSWDFPTAYSSQPMSYEFMDITGDGAPEWFVSRPYSPWGNISRGEYYQESIISWQDGRLVNIKPDVGAVNMENLDDDPALEMFNAESHYDSWGCSAITRTVYDWNGTNYVLLAEPVVERQRCEAHDAEAAMWRGDFRSAVDLYNTFLDANKEVYAAYVACRYGPGDYACVTGIDTPAIYNYFLSRRVIAYALLGDGEQVRVSLDALRAVEHPDILGQALLALHSIDTETLCREAHDVFTSGEARYYAEFDRVLGVFTPGAVYEDVGNMYSDTYFGLGYQIDPIKVGCDIHVFDPVPMAAPTATPSPAPTFTPYPTLTPDQKLLVEPIAPHFRAGEYQTVLWMAEHADQRGSAQADYMFEMAYWRALALEALGEGSAAATAYAQLARDALGTAWGMLAAFHLE